MWTPLSRASGLDGVPQLRGSWGHWPWRLSRRSHRTTLEAATVRARRHLDDDRVIHTGFAALDAILGPGGLPKSASVAIRGDGSSGRTTLSLRVAAEAQAQGSVVAWLDLSRSFDPVEAVARGVRLEWLVVITPGQPGRGPLDRGLRCSPGARSTCSSSTCPAAGWRRPTSRPRIADRLHRLAALARRAETLLLILDAPGLSGGLATAVAESTGIRLELARRSWIRLGRDIVGQRTEALVARNRYGPPGRRATLRILYAEGGERDACLRRDDLLLEAIPTADKAPATDSNGPTAMRLLHLYRPHLPLELALARASEPFPPARSCWAAGRGIRARSSTRTRTPGRSASGGGSRWERPSTRP